MTTDLTPTPLGGDLLVNTTTAGDQGTSSDWWGSSSPKITALAGGGFVVIWPRRTSDADVFAQIFNQDGVPVGEEIVISTIGIAGLDVTALEGGGFAVTWASVTSGFDVRLQVFDASGNALAPPSIVNAEVGQFPYNQEASSITSLAGGGFVVTWNDIDVLLNARIAYARLYDAAGQPVSEQFRLDPSSNFNQYFADIVPLQDGGFVAVWSSQAFITTSPWDVLGQRFDAAGAPVGERFIVNTTLEGAQIYHGTAPLAGGGFVVAWQSEGSIVARLYDADAAPAGGEIVVRSFVAGTSFAPNVAGTADGGFVVSWTEFGESGVTYEVRAQRFAADGTPLSTDFQVHAASTIEQYASELVVLTDGTLVATWLAPDADGLGVYARRFELPTDNAAPLAGVSIGQQTIAEDTAFVFTVPTGAFLDPDGDPLALSAGLVGGFALPGSLAFDALTGSFSGAPPADFNGTLTIRVTATDPDGLSAFQDFELVINAVDDAPIGAGDVYAIARGRTLTVPATGGVLANDTDADAGDALSAVLVSSTGRGRLTLNSDGSFTYVPPRTFVGLDSFTYEAVDSDGLRSGPVTVHIAVGANALTLGDDSRTFGASNDVVFALAGNDSVEAGAGNDTVDGGDGEDTLSGGAGKDALIGGDGNDWLFGGAGDDALTGGAGADRFAFGAGGGRDTILDFVIGEDSVTLLDGLSLARLQVKGGSSVATLSDGSSITFAGVVLQDWALVG